MNRAKLQYPFLVPFTLIGLVVLLLQACEKEECLPKLPNQIITLHRSIVLKPGEEGKDISLHSISPTSNTGNDPKLHAWVGTWSGVPGRLRCFIDFDYSTIPQGAIITSAALTLYADTVSLGIGFGPKGHNPLTASNAWEMRRVTSSWEEAAVDYAHQPAFDDVGKISLAASASPSQAYTIDVTHFVKDQQAHPDLYFGMTYELTTTVPHASISFFSSDAPYSKLRPEMTISYDVDITLPNH